METFVQGLVAVANVGVLLGILIGVTIGMFVGAFPGVTATMSMAIASAFTITMSPIQGIAVLMSVYIAAMFSDRIPAILINTPGTPGSVASTFDGFPLSKQGKAGLALYVSGIGSLVGGLVGIAVFAFASFPLAQFALRFGPPEIFALVVFGLTMMVSVSGETIVKGLIAGFIGLTVGIVGLDPIFGFPRFTVGVLQVQEGISFIAVIIGLFGIAEVLEQVLTRRRDQSQEVVTQLGRWRPNKDEYKQLPKPIAIGSVIGAFVGAIPAAGGDIAGLVSWDRAKRMSKRPEEFGKGSIEGLAAADTSNNAVIGGALTTTLALGIPGDTATAVVLGSMLVWGITPGPDLFVQEAALVYSIVGVLLIATLLAFALSLLRLQSVVKLLSLPKPLLWSAIVLFCLVGTFAVSNALLDVWIMLGAGVVGLTFRRFGFPLGPVVLGLLLGPLAEANIRQALTISNGSFSVILFSPIAMVLLSLSALAIILPVIRSWKLRRSHETP
jgi:putative tricarboxylic transport membrane protein